MTAPQLSPGFLSQVPKVFGTEVGQGMAFEMTPDVFDGIEFRCVCRQAGQNEVALRPLDVTPHRTAAMHRQTIPDHQQFAGNLATEVAKKLGGLSAFDTAPIETKIKLPPGNAGDDGELAPRVMEYQLRVWPLGAQVRTTLGRSEMPLSSTKTMVSGLPSGTFF